MNTPFDLNRAFNQASSRSPALATSLMLALMILFALTNVSMADEPVSKRFFGNVAIEGHDSVAYHQSHEAGKHEAAVGEPDFTAEYKGAVWRFASAKSRDQFRADPDRYAPAYNGHCANALALGEGLIGTDGTHWEIFGDKLYLFYADRGRQRWLVADDFRVYKNQADQAWAGLIK